MGKRKPQPVIGSMLMLMFEAEGLTCRPIMCKTLEECSAATREQIEKNNLGSGCGSMPAFLKAEIFRNGRKIGRVSYNGRIWDNADKEMTSLPEMAR